MPKRIRTALKIAAIPTVEWRRDSKVMTISLRISSSALLAVILFLLCSEAWAVDDQSCQSDADVKAVETIKTMVQKDKLYTSWTTEPCLSFYPERCDAENVEVAIRELHTPECGGDSNTGPVVDRFRVFKRISRIDWFDYLEAEYVEYSKVHSIGGR